MRILLAALLTAIPATARTQERPPDDVNSIFHAVTGEKGAKADEVSTEELRSILASGAAVLLDARPHLEWAISHIPGARNVAPKPGMPMSEYTSDVAEVGRLVALDRTRPLILYCNGPFCGKSKRVSEDLLAAGYSNVRRYQLGAPVWRALGGVMVTEPDGVRYILEKDGTAVFIDARDPAEYEAASLPGAVNLPQSRLGAEKGVGEVMTAKDDGRLPMYDHNTRIVVFGRDGEQARSVAEAIAREAFHNVSYFEGEFRILQALAMNRRR